MEDPFVPPDFEVPESFAWGPFHLEPLGEVHNDRDYDAWMSSIDHIHTTPGFPDGNWPSPMSKDDNLKDLIRHARDFKDRKGFTYSILIDEDVVGCVYIYPSDSDHDAEVSSWVRASHAEVDTEVWKALSDWIDEVWPFTNPRYDERT